VPYIGTSLEEATSYCTTLWNTRFPFTTRVGKSRLIATPSKRLVGLLTYSRLSYDYKTNT